MPFPPVADCGPIIARFDQMSSPFQAILWGRVLPLQTFDQAQITAYWNQWGGRTNLEPLCPTPNGSGSPSASPGASGSPDGSTAPTDTPGPDGHADSDRHAGPERRPERGAVGKLIGPVAADAPRLVSRAR